MHQPKISKSLFQYIVDNFQPIRALYDIVLNLNSGILFLIKFAHKNVVTIFNAIKNYNDNDHNGLPSHSA